MIPVGSPVRPPPQQKQLPARVDPLRTGCVVSGRGPPSSMRCRTCVSAGGVICCVYSCCVARISPTRKRSFTLTPLPRFPCDGGSGPRFRRGGARVLLKVTRSCDAGRLVTAPFGMRTTLSRCRKCSRALKAHERARDKRATPPPHDRRATPPPRDRRATPSPSRRCSLALERSPPHQLTMIRARSLPCCMPAAQVTCRGAARRLPARQIW